MPRQEIEARGGPPLLFTTISTPPCAKRLSAKASTLGLQPAIAQTEAGSWRVGVGPYADKAEALAVRDKVRDAGLAVVIKTP